MAKIKTTGLEDLEKRLLNHEKAAEAAVPEMLEAGAAVMTKAEREEIERLGLVDTGDMKNSIAATKIRKTESGAFIEVYPQGKDRKGVRNATKAFVAQYGKSNMPARPWLTAARAKGESGVNEAMREAWRKKQND